MAGSITIHLTDPTASSFEVRDFTTDSSKHPLTTTFDATSVQSNTTLYIGGRGVTKYGERIFENMVQMLEHHSSSSEPKNPIIGQLWHSREQYIIAQSDRLYAWDFSTDTWIDNGIVNLNTLPYWFDGSILYYRSSDTTHPLYNIDVVCEHVYNPSVVDPNASNIIPTHRFKVYEGNNTWKLLNDFPVSASAPFNPPEGQLWYDTTNGYLKVYDGATWNKTVDDYLPLSGGTLAGPVDFMGNVTFGSGITINSGGNRITNAADPINPQDVATRQWVMTYVTTGSEYLSLGELSDVVLTSPSTTQYLRHDGTNWVNANLSLTDLGISPLITPSEIDFLNGVSSPIQTQITDKFSLSSNNTITTPGLIFDFNTNRLRNITTDSNVSTDAANVGYVNTTFFPLIGGTVYGSVYTGSLTSSVDVVSGGIAINQGNIGNSLTIRHSGLVDIPFGTPSGTSTKTYFSIKEYNNITGGAGVYGFAGDDTPSIPTTGLALNGYVVTPGNTTSNSGCVKINGAKYDSLADDVQSISNGDNILTVENNNDVVFLIKGDGTVQILGDLVVSGSTTLTSIDGGSF